MAAAASTLLYQLQYGGDDGKYASDHSDALDDLCAFLDDDEDYKPNGLVFSDDDDFLIDIDYDLEDELLQSSFCCKPLINVPYIRTFGAPDQGQMLDVQESQTTKSALRDD